jgi:hypothetical protein
VVNPLSTKMLSGEVEEGSEIRLDMKKWELTIQ